jgi:hypothetical protein
MKFDTRPLYALLLTLAAASAQAQVITIDQAKALAGNVTPGDTPGFPITIGQPGSYRLSGPLTVGDIGQWGVIIAAPNVTLDLNGFAITGPRCGPTRCQIVQSYVSGISVQAPGAIIANGTVDAFASAGISSYAGADLLLERVHVRRNGSCGLNLNGATVVRNVVASDNAGCGIHTQVGGLIQGVVAAGNGRYQVTAANGSLLSSSTLIGPAPQFGGGVTSTGDNLCKAEGSPAVKC